MVTGCKIGGEGAEKDPEEVAEFLIKACELGHEESCQMVKR